MNNPFIILAICLSFGVAISIVLVLTSTKEIDPNTENY